MFRSLSDLTKASVFYSLAFAFCVVVALSAPILGPNTPFFAMFTPALAVLALMLVVSRDGYTRAGWAVLGLHRAGWRAWGTALLVLGFSYGMPWVSGLAHFSIPPEARPLAMLPVNLLIMIVAGTLLGGLGGELGWRGFLFPESERMSSFTTASLIVGLVWALYHLPLFLFSDYNSTAPRAFAVVMFFISAIALTFVHNWFRARSGSVWPNVWAHRDELPAAISLQIQSAAVVGSR